MATQIPLFPVKKMDRNEALTIARETLWQLVRCKELFTGAYEYITMEMDITDETLKEANKFLEDEYKESLKHTKSLEGKQALAKWFIELGIDDDGSSNSQFLGLWLYRDAPLALLDRQTGDLDDLDEATIQRMKDKGIAYAKELGVPFIVDDIMRDWFREHFPQIKFNSIRRK